MDMLKIEYDLLKYIQENQPITYANLLNGFCQSHNISLSDCDDILQCLMEGHCLYTGVSAQERHSATFRLSPRTTQKLYQYEQERDEKARQERIQETFAKYSAHATVFGSIAGAIVGALIAFLFTLFGRTL